MSTIVNIIVVFFVLTIIIAALDIQIQRPEIVFNDEDVIGDLKVQVRRLKRGSPYVVVAQFYLKAPAGDNVTIGIKLFEKLSGRYLPTFVMYDSKLCEFYKKDEYLGKLLTEQFADNFTCPMPIGRYTFSAVEIHLEHFPYALPITWPMSTINVRLDLTWTWTASGKNITIVSFYAILNLSPSKKSKLPLVGQYN